MISSTFVAPGQSASINGKKLSVLMTYGATGTVALECYDDGLAAWTAVASYTAAPAEQPVVVDDVVRRPWRLNCTAVTGTITYVMRNEQD